MKIALINGSPKIKESTSGLLLKDVKSYIGERAEVLEIALHKPIISDQTIEELKTVDVFIFSCPLYVDGIPGHLLSCLCQLEKEDWQDCQISIYGIVNCGFYEGEQAKIALQILKNWTHKLNFDWGDGLGVGGGGALMQMPTTQKNHGPKAPVDKALQTLVETIFQGNSQENQYVSIAFPRFLYRIAAQTGWRQLIRSNGGKIKDLAKQWNE